MFSFKKKREDFSDEDEFNLYLEKIEDISKH